MSDAAAYAGLFFSAFLAATIFPASSEAVFAALLASNTGQPETLFAVALLGNVLGSLTDWLLGRFLLRFQDRRWFPVGPAAYARAVTWFNRYGLWSLLLSWAPVIGDPLCVVAGALRVRLPAFLFLVTLGKAARYLLLMGGVAVFMA